MSAGQLAKRPRKGESGTQLLARLNSRADLSSLDPDVFNKAPSSLPLNSFQSSAHAKIIEIYGLEGVGKTEMVLSYVAKACLPSNWNGYSLNGLGSKVIFIDTEFKFSVLRLAIIMEKQLLALCEKLRQTYTEDEEITGRNSICVSCSSSAVKTKQYPDSEQLENKDILRIHDAGSSTCSSGSSSSTYSTVSDNLLDASEERLGITDKKVKSCSHEHSFSGDRELNQSLIAADLTLTPQDIENIVQDALGRVQVISVLSTEKLLATLLSLEHILSCDSLISMIVIDTISAFYWIDKLGDVDNPSCTELNMSPIANVISKYTLDFGITHLVIQSALISNNRLWNEECSDLKNRGKLSSFTEETARNEKVFCEYVQFLGKSWSKLRSKKIVLTSSVDQKGKVDRSAVCSEWEFCKRFTCTDDGFRFC